MRTSCLVYVAFTLICSVASADQVPIHCPQGYTNVAGNCVVTSAQNPLAQPNTQSAGGPIPSAIILPLNTLAPSINTSSSMTAMKSGSLSALKSMQVVKTSDNSSQPSTAVPSVVTPPSVLPQIQTQQSSVEIKPVQQMQTNNTPVNTQNISATTTLPIPPVAPINKSLFAPLNFANSNSSNNDSSKILDLTVTTSPSSTAPFLLTSNPNFNSNSNSPTTQPNQSAAKNSFNLNNTTSTSTTVSPILLTGGSTTPQLAVIAVPTFALPSNNFAAGAQLPSVVVSSVPQQNLTNQAPINIIPTTTSFNNGPTLAPPATTTPMTSVNSSNCAGIWVQNLKSCLPISCPHFYEWNKVTKACEIPKPDCRPGYTWSGLYCLPTSIINGTYPPINSTQQLARGLVCPQGQWKCQYHVCPQGFTFITSTCIPVANTSVCPSANLNNNGGCDPNFVLIVDIKKTCVIGKSRWNGTACEPIQRQRM